MTKLFISYAHLDSEIVVKAADDLRNAGYEVWIDTSGIQAGDLWVEEITEGISSCDIFVLFISAKSVLSDYVRRELDLAFDAKKRMIPVRLDASELPTKWKYQLAGIQYIDIQHQAWKERLIRALQSEQKPVPPAGRDTGPLPPLPDTGKLKNPYASLPLLERLERELILSNRKEELKKATGQLDDHRLLVVTGMPGIGKSTFARALLDFRPDGSPIPFWYNFRHQQSSGNSLGILLERISGYLDFSLNAEIQKEVMAFRASGGNASANDVDILISYLNQEKPIWLVFDNLETVLSPETSNFLDNGLDLLFDRLKNNMHNARIIITNPFVPMLKSGEPLLEMGGEAISLQGLDIQSAVAFLRAFGLKNISDEKLETVVSDTGGHPFILNQIAHYIQIFGITTALENLQGGLDEVNEKFGRTLQDRLPPQELGALRSLTVLNREISLSGLCQIARVKQGVIFRLREKGLLQTNDSGKFWLHNIVRNSLKLTDPEELREMHLRAVNFFRNQTIPSFTQSIEEYANVLEWHHHAVEAADVVSAYAALFSAGLESQLMRWNEYELLASLCERTISAMYQVDANSQVEANLSPLERVKIYHTLGVAYFLLGKYTESILHLTSAVAFLPPGQDDRLRARLLIDLSESYNSHGDYRQAMDACREVEELMPHVEDEILHAKLLHLRGIIHRDHGALDDAISDLETAQKLYKSQNDRVHFANVTGDMGIVYYFQNKFDEALSNYRQVIVSCEEIGDMRGKMLGHLNVSDILLLEGSYELAEKELRIAIELARKQKITWKELEAGLYLAESFIALSKYDEANAELTKLKPLIKQNSSTCLLGLQLSLVARLQWRRNQIDLAQGSFKQAFTYLEMEGCQYECARAYISYAEFLADARKQIAAEEVLEKGRRLFKQLNNLLGLRAIDNALLRVRNQAH